jgi:putative nucleotidyltransferase with HDIG domain
MRLQSPAGAHGAAPARAMRDPNRRSASYPPTVNRSQLLNAALVGGGLAAGGLFLADRLRSRSRFSRLHRATVEMLLNALTADDESTARHSRRVADLTDALAEPLHLSAKQRATLRVASLLHDMGKVDDRFFDIVHGRESLSEEEREEIERHPHESASILEPLEWLHRGLSAIVASHHERWDGGGYPQGLSGPEIPLGSRLIAVADVFDALTQARSYRDPMSVDEALAEIRRCAGQQFDPEIARLLARPAVSRRWREIVERGRRDEEAAQSS